MPSDRNESFIRKNIDDFISLVKRVLGNSDALGASTIDKLLDNLAMLKSLDIEFFGADGERVPSAEELGRFADLCRQCRDGIFDIVNFETNSDINDLSVLSACGIISSGADVILTELMPYVNLKKPDFDWQLSDEQKDEALAYILSCREDFSGVIDERVMNFEQRQHFYSRWDEFPETLYDDSAKDGFRRKPGDYGFPKEIKLTGNVNDLACYYIMNKDLLSSIEQRYIRNRIGALAYLDELAMNVGPSSPVFGVRQKKGGQDYTLVGCKGKYQYQTTGNGCWSCAYAMLLEGRGISLNQQVIRAFRPDVGVNDVADVDEFNAAGVFRDDMFSPLEMADLTVKLVPDTATRQVGVNNINPRNPKQTADLKNFIKSVIREAKGPVAFTDGVHFRTIIGISGNKVKLLNSLETNETLEETVTLDKLIEDRPSISLTYLQGLDFKKDGSCNSVPEKFGKVSYEGGRLMNPGRNKGVLNRSGELFSASEQFGSLTISDSIYLPEKVPEAVYSRKIDARNEKEQAFAKENRPAAGAAYPGDIVSAIDAEIAAAHAQIINVIEKWDDIASPEYALKYAVAAMLAKRTLLDAYENTNDPEKDLHFADLVEDTGVVNDVMRSESFDRFYTTVVSKEILKLSECAPEERSAAEDRFYDSFVSFISAPKAEKPQSEKLQAENAKTGNSKDIDSTAAGQKKEEIIEIKK